MEFLALYECFMGDILSVTPGVGLRVDPAMTLVYIFKVLTTFTKSGVSVICNGFPSSIDTAPKQVQQNL